LHTSKETISPADQYPPLKTGDEWFNGNEHYQILWGRIVAEQGNNHHTIAKLLSPLPSITYPPVEVSKFIK